MLLQLVNVLYVLVAIAMIGLILMQRGTGAQAGSGFGGGASATVFGSRGSSNFLTKSTKWLGVLFFGISLGMAYYASKTAREGNGPTAADLGVMGQTAQTKQPAPVAKVPTAQVPAAGATQPASPVNLPQYDQKAPAGSAPAQQAPTPAAPAQGK
ncbi:preprotein translocase subunit SecG [Thermomonas sp.]|uniref:preprotein translocase subunit SecG n=1 Tax=Thermomonas sp. TaxID=1971895 RepID=UPI002488490A|nr:preprotein translocase subunit SecG [Thermomonas sp.]MDI1253601.1 preprotein translocase subunit SecG [Thermomonas sp.]